MSEPSGVSVRARRRGRPPGSRSGLLRNPDSDTALPAEPVRGRNRRGRPPTRQRPGSLRTASSEELPPSSPAVTPQTPHTPAQPPFTVIDPRLFAQNAAPPSPDQQQKLDAYLQSSVTLWDDQVVTSRPAVRNPKRVSGQMTVPDQPVSAEPAESHNERALRMEADIAQWVEDTASTMHRISQLRRQGRLRDTTEPPLEPRLLPPALEEPEAAACEPQRRTRTMWDQLLIDAGDRYREMTVVGRRVRVAIRKRARQIAREREEQLRRRGVFQRPEQAERAAAEHSRRLAKWTAAQVMRKWSFVEGIVEEQRQMELEEEKSREDKRVLFDMLQRSTQLLEEQRAGPADLDEFSSDEDRSEAELPTTVGTVELLGEPESEPDESDGQMDVDSESSEEFSSESETDDEMDALARDQDVPVEDLMPQMDEESTVGSDEETLGLAALAGDTHTTEQPTLLRGGDLRVYQRQGLDWLAALQQQKVNGILADEMGLGKTIQTLALLAYLAEHRGIWGPHLIIVPTSVLLNWEQELHRWIPGFKVLTYYGSRAERKQKRQGWSKPNAFHVCVTSYQLAIQDARVFGRKHWCYMVLDEAQAIKNFRSQRWQTLLGFRAQHRLLLTGTPLQNSLTELWSLLYFLMPQEEGLAGVDRFREWFAQPLEKLLAAQPVVSGDAHSFMQGTDAALARENEALDAVRKLHTVLRPHVLRRLKRDVERQLPDKVEHVVYCTLSKRQRQLYDDFMQRAQTRDTLQRGTYLGVMGCLMQLRKVCNHPDLFETRPIVTSWAVSGGGVAAFAHVEQAVRRRFATDMPWSANGQALWAQPGLLVASVEKQAQQAVARLDATPNLVRCGLGAAQNALEIVASEEKSWEELQMRPRELRFRSVEHSMRAINVAGLESSADAWLRLAALNRARVQATQTAVYRVPSLARAVHRNLLADGRLVLTGAQRLAQLDDVIKRFMCVTPSVVVRNTPADMERVSPYMSTSGLEHEIHPSVLHVRQRVQRTGLMQPVMVRQQIQFPEPSLLQYDCGKLQALDRLLRQLLAAGRRVLLFTQMTRVLDILERWLNLRGLRYLRLDGATRVEQRWRLTEMFNHDRRWSVFISSTRAGGLGINLTGADTVIFYDSDWNHAMDAQCQDRCHRIGQLREVHIYRLISQSTVEEAIWRKQCEKRWLDSVVIQQGQFDPNKRDAALPSPSPVAPLAVGDWYDLASAVLQQQQNPGEVLRSTTEQRPEVSEREAGRALAAAEDAEDTRALQVAITEVARADALDLGMDADQATEELAAPVEEASGGNDDDGIGHIDDYMLRFITEFDVED
ncbi:swr1 complex component [Coemansia sp. RSA 2611]|nr:swr1 complex component [Coemansia sp. RSA 2611]